jgi:hypothetical protein
MTGQPKRLVAATAVETHQKFTRYNLRVDVSCVLFLDV